MTAAIDGPEWANRWFVPLARAHKPRVTLICFPHAGGGAASYRTWPTYLPYDVQLLAAELPGRGARFGEPLLKSVDAVVDALSAQRDFLEAQGPLAFFGHSMGAAIAFELAIALERSGVTSLRQVVVSAHRSPHAPRRDVAIDALTDEEFVDELRRFQGLRQELLDFPELLALVLPTLRADFELAYAYRAASEAELQCDLTVVGGRDDPMVDAAALGKWAGHARGRFGLEVMPGGHFFIDANIQRIVELSLGQVSPLGMVSTALV